jgi:protein phosphatase
MENALLDELATAMTASGWWDRFQSDWFCLDCELMPWSAKAQELLKHQYAAVGAAGQASLQEAAALLENSAELCAALREREGCVARYRDAYARYCWPVASAADLRLAPFHLLAAEGQAFTHQDHLWHMQTLTELAKSPIIQATRHLLVDLGDAASVQATTRWWEELTAAGGEGMVVKPREWIVQGPKGLVQPAMKCRGREYLRIIYGPEYTLSENIARLRKRSTGAKRSLASREFALGLEALERFVRREPLRRVHECVFGVLALESEPVDPRL